MDIVLQPKQQVAFNSAATEILYGGAAGGGKSVLLRASVIRWCLEIPGIQVYLFRRTLRDLRDNHLRGPMSFFFMLGEMLKSGHVKHRQVENEFSFWNGSVLHLCYCDSESDVENYRGSEMHVLAIDELTHFTEFQYRFLRHRVRLAGLNIPEKYKNKLPRVETGSNPGSVGHAWVKKTFVSPKPPTEVWTCPPDEGGMDRQYIPARLADNLHLMRDDPKYIDRLKGMGSDHLVRAQLDGDWDIIAGQAFEKLRKDVHGLEPFTPNDNWQIFGSLDWGSSRPFSFGLWGVSPGEEVHGRWIQKGALVRFDEWYGWTGKANEGLRLETAEVADGIKAKLDGRRPAYIIADPSMKKVDGGPSHAETMLGRGVVLRMADNSRIAGYLAVRDRIAGNEDGPMLYATTNCHAGFWRSMPDIVMDERHVEDVDTSQEDHCFVANTLVRTYNGLQRIGDLVGSEGMVWAGKWVPYRSCRLTRRDAAIVEVLFSDGTRINCTPDHRFMLESGEWCEAQNLPGKKIRSSLAKLRRNLVVRAITCVGNIFRGMALDFTAWSGKRTTEKYQPAFISTTLMKIQATTGLRILQSLMLRGTCRFMEAAPRQSPEAGNISNASVLRRLNGTAAKKESLGIKNTTSSIALRGCIEKSLSLARTAKVISLQNHHQYSALQLVGLPIGANVELMTSKKLAPHAEQSLFQAVIQKIKIAVVNAVLWRAQKSVVECLGVKREERSDVYCLTVPEFHWFTVEGGIVVSNCYDDVRYASMSRPWVRHIDRPREKPDRWMRAFEREDEAVNDWKVI